MGSDPAWYEALPKWWQEVVDQAAHQVLSFFLALVCADRLFVWWREWVQQWPPGDPLWFRANSRHADLCLDPEQTSGSRHDSYYRKQLTELDRVEDTKTDYLHYSIGGTVGHLTQVGVLLWWVLR